MEELKALERYFIWKKNERPKDIMKKEAIKWCKADKSNYLSKQGKEETILWIKQFFNITDKDLQSHKN